MSVPTCTYLKPNGAVCNSPALRGQRLCYFHLDPLARQIRQGLAKAYCALRIAKARRQEARRRARRRKFTSL